METGYLLNIIWVTVAAVLVFFMQAGFAMVEAGFIRAKNAGNIIMKNVMDFAIGSIVFYFIGFGLMFGDTFNGLIGSTGFFSPDQMSISAFEGLTPAVFIFFQTVFAATTATIVSGAMAERTRFSSYIAYSAVISIVIYPTVGHWIWGDGWLANLGFVDFAGSTVVHSVGGWAALVGAATVGPRIGKYSKEGKPLAIPGHNLLLGALGVFILWMGWFGFNGGSTLEASFEIGHIAMTTNLAAAAAAISAMTITWMRYGKPEVSMTLNGVLAGLVAVTAGCQVVTIKGSVFIGVIAGFVVVFGVELIDKVLKVDDPVGAVAVHGMNGVVGTLMVGLFANYAPGTEDAVTGLFYGGGLRLLGIQATGVAAVGAWTLATTFVLFQVIKRTMGLRVSHEHETLGLDINEHNTQAYTDFIMK